MGHPLEIYAPYLRERARERQRKRAEKKNQQNTRIYKPIQCAQLNAAESEFEFEFKWQIFDSQKKLENEINEIIIIFRPTLGDSSPAAL